MKKQQLFILTLLLLLFSRLAFGNVDTLSVLSVNGLQLKEDSVESSTTILTIPFLQKVKILEDSSYTTDLVYDEMNPIMRSRWIKVRYNNKEGYVNDINLFDHYSLKTLLEDENQNRSIGLSFAWGDCNQNVHPNPNIKWKGVCKIEGKYIIKDVNVSYAKTAGMYSVDVGMRLENAEGLVFLIGSENNVFKNGEITGTSFVNIQGLVTSDYSEGDLKMNYPYFKGSRDEQGYLTLTLTGKYKEQQLEKIRGDGDTYLRWKGDLDGDGKDDFIISHGDKSAKVILYLSGSANKDEYVKPVAFYSTGYCC